MFRRKFPDECQGWREGNGLAWAMVLEVGLICSALERKGNLEVLRENGPERERIPATPPAVCARD